MSASVWERIASAVIRRRRVIIAAWLTAALGLAPLAARIQRRLETTVRIRGSESARVEALLGSQFRTRFARYAVLVVRGLPPVTDSAGRARLRDIVRDIATVPYVTGTLSVLNGGDSLFVGRGRPGETLVVVGLDAQRPMDTVLVAVRARTASIVRHQRDAEPAITMLWTGTGPLTVDLRRASADDAARAERRIMPMTLVLLIVAFGSLAAATLPVVAGGLAITTALGVAALIGRWLTLSVLLLNIATMLGLGLGIDYALLMVSRFREARTRGLDALAAARDAGAHAGESIVISGGAVLLGFVGLLLVPLSDLRSIALGGVLVTGASVLVATTLVPAILSFASGPVPRRAARRQSDRRWRRWSVAVLRRPLVVLGVAGVALIATAWPARHLERRMPNGDWLPPSMESARGVRALHDMHRDGIVQAIRIVVEFPPGVTALSPEGWQITARVAERIARDPRVATVRALPRLVDTASPSPLLLAIAPPEVISSFVGLGGRRALIEVMPSDSSAARDAMALVSDLRRDAHDAVRFTGREDVRVLVGGLPAVNVDYENAIDGSTPLVVGVVVLGTLVALMIGFRSILVPIKAVLLNLLTVSAAFGLLVLVFQDGHAVRWLGVAQPLDGIFSAVPLLVFCVMFGLSMDYEVFLVSRVAESHARGRPNGPAIVDGVRRTGGVITSAGLVMTAVFGAFVAGDFVLMKMLGFALTAAVLIDITLVRLALGPALLALAGDWNWWPGRRRRVRGEAANRKDVAATAGATEWAGAPVQSAK